MSVLRGTPSKTRRPLDLVWLLALSARADAFRGPASSVQSFMRHKVVSFLMEIELLSKQFDFTTAFSRCMQLITKVLFVNNVSSSNKIKPLNGTKV